MTPAIKHLAVVCVGGDLETPAGPITSEACDTWLTQLATETRLAKERGDKSAEDYLAIVACQVARALGQQRDWRRAS